MGALERITVEVEADMAAEMRRSVAEGTYESTDQIVGEALQDWARERAVNDAEVQRLRELIEEADASGPPIPEEEAFARLDEHIARFAPAR